MGDKYSKIAVALSLFEQ